MKRIFYIAGILSFFISCKDGIRHGSQSIRFGDSALIITEKDSEKLQNFTRDISPASQGEQDIARMMVQVDSVKESEKLKEELKTGTRIGGFTISFAECEITFDGLEAREWTPQNPEKNKSVSYVVTSGDISGNKILLKGLQHATIEERIFTKLKVSDHEKDILLKSLGRKISDWFNLAGQDSIFISAGSNSFQFNDLNHENLKQALDKELRAGKESESEIRNWMKRIQNTHSYTDAPCKVYVSTAQYRIKGEKNGKSISKLVQFDIVE